MSTGPAKQDRPAEAPAGDATVVFVPPTSEVSAQPLPPSAELAPEALAGGGTGAYLPAPSPANEEVASAAPGATGFFLPEAPTGNGDPNPEGGTGIYVPPMVTPGAVSSSAIPGQGDGTGVLVPGLTGQRGNSPWSNTAGAEAPSAAANPESQATGNYQAAEPKAPAERAPAGKGRSAAAGSHCGRYVLKRFHAKGGMGEIWVADDPAIGRSVALKRMLGRRPDQQRRFLMEAQVTGQLEHPGIVPVHELGSNDQGQPYYVMKFVHGQTLKKVVEKYHATKVDAGADREVEQVRLLQNFISLCQTVAYAHSRGVLHRDLKPENVMLGPYGETLLLDWGIAKVMGQPENSAQEGESSYVHLYEAGKDTETQAGAIMGSPSYMAPEVAAGLNAEVDQRSDVYLLGATLYEILTGKVPRQANTVFEMIQQAQHKPPPPPRTVKPEVSKALEAICLKAMALQKEDRYQGALELAEDVQRYIAGEPVSAYREGPLVRVWRWAKRHRTALTRTAAAALCLGVLGFGYVKYREAEERQEAARREAEELREQEQARREVKDFRRLADEARFYAATTDQVSEHAPYFDPLKGEATGKAAVALAERWGPRVEQLVLTEEQESVRNELYDLQVLMAQAKSQQTADAQAGQEMLALLDHAAQLRDPSRSYHRLRAEAYHRLGEDNKAAGEKQQAEDAAKPATALDHFLLAEQNRKQAAGKGEGQGDRKAWQPDPERMETAIEQYRLALAIDPDHFWSHFQLGRCYLSLERLPEAAEALGTCVALQPKSPWAYSARGVVLDRQKRYQEAERDLDWAIELSPDSRPARLNRGVVYWQQKKYEAALVDFEAVLQPPLDRQLIEAAYYRGQLYLQQGKVQESLEDFDRVIATNPNFRPVYPLRARIHISRSEKAQGLKDLDTYLAEGRKADHPAWETSARRGRLLRVLYSELPQEQRRGKSAQALLALALTELQQAVDQGGQAPALFDDLGAVLEHAGQLKMALDAYSRGLELAPRDVKLLIKRAWAYEQGNLHDKARADFALATQVEPENAEAHSGLGYVRAVGKASPDAQREANMALLHGPENHLVLHNVACIYAVLAQADARQSAAHEDAAMALLRRAVDVWKKGGTGPSEIDLMKDEAAFPQSLRDRPEFQKLIRDNDL